MKILLAFACALVLAACGGGSSGKPEPSASRKAAQPPWDAAANPFVAPGWTSGDAASWQAQMVRRAQNQNEFLRVN
jgi:ABC-type glycerol-3-phosphate transport system substrate-binding protein